MLPEQSEWGFYCSCYIQEGSFGLLDAYAALMPAYAEPSFLNDDWSTMKCCCLYPLIARMAPFCRTRSTSRISLRGALPGLLHRRIPSTTHPSHIVYGIYIEERSQTEDIGIYFKSST